MKPQILLYTCECLKYIFGYDMPLNFGAKMLRSLALIPLFLSGVAVIDREFLDGKLGTQKFLTGQGNNDVAYQKHQEGEDSIIEE